MRRDPCRQADVFYGKKKGAQKTKLAQGKDDVFAQAKLPANNGV